MAIGAGSCCRCCVGAPGIGDGDAEPEAAVSEADRSRSFSWSSAASAALETSSSRRASGNGRHCTGGGFGQLVDLRRDVVKLSQLVFHTPSGEAKAALGVATRLSIRVVSVL